MVAVEGVERVCPNNAVEHVPRPPALLLRVACCPTKQLPPRSLCPCTHTPTMRALCAPCGAGAAPPRARRRRMHSHPAQQRCVRPRAVGEGGGGGSPSVEAQVRLVQAAKRYAQLEEEAEAGEEAGGGKGTARALADWSDDDDDAPQQVTAVQA